MLLNHGGNRCVHEIQWLYYESTIIGVFWDYLWHKSFVCMICEIYLALECAQKPSWPTGFEKSKIHQPNLEELQFEGSKIEAILLIFMGKRWKLDKNASISLPSNCNSSRLGWWILDFSKPVGQGGLWAHFEPKWVTQFMQIKVLCHKKSQNTPKIILS